jgi:membrane fusion protein, macrolide-specific efflux system
MTAIIRRLRGRPRLSLTVAVIAVLAIGIGTYAVTRGGGAAAADATTTVQTVATGTIKQSVSATGTLAPATQASLTFPVSGQVTAVDVAVGDKVTASQVLAKIDASSLAVGVAQAKSTVATAQAKVDADATNGADSTQTAADQAALTAANNQLSSAESQQADATMTSPIDGVVATVNLVKGQTVSATSTSGSSGTSGTSGSSGTSGATGGGDGTSGAGTGTSSTSSTTTAQILVISTNSWIVNATVDATSVGLIAKGEQAQLTVTGSTGAVYGTISSIGLVSSSTSTTASYPAVVAVTGSPSGLHDGAGVTAALIYKQLTNVVVVPSTALHRNSSGGQYVEQVTNGKTVDTTVKVGIASAGQTQITSGLKAGDQIVVPVIQRPTGTTGTTNRGGQGGTGGRRLPRRRLPRRRLPRRRLRRGRRLRWRRGRHRWLTHPRSRAARHRTRLRQLAGPSSNWTVSARSTAAGRSSSKPSVTSPWSSIPVSTWPSWDRPAQASRR